ncbi:MAG: heat shock protein Hsp20 [Phycisphaerales bacterium]|jgi:HSP20 family protein|nr:heat shock protein Hsp20 [Phycisphaerales bacterium]MDB5354069.1 heat shock protein Hsp20 [Phycisphaerales bacterium]
MPMSAAVDPPFQNLARQARKLMDQMQKGYYTFSPSDVWTPNVNLYETATSYLVCVDLAGVDKDKIDLEVHDGRLRLRGSRPVPIREDIESEEQSEHEHKKMRVHLMEIDHGSFSREVELPSNINCDAISASYRNGMLWVEIPKA